MSRSGTYWRRKGKKTLRKALVGQLVLSLKFLPISFFKCFEQEGQALLTQKILVSDHFISFKSRIEKNSIYSVPFLPKTEIHAHFFYFASPREHV